MKDDTHTCQSGATSILFPLTVHTALHRPGVMGGAQAHINEGLKLALLS